MRHPTDYEDYDSHEDYEEAQERKGHRKKSVVAKSSGVPEVPVPVVFTEAIQRWTEQFRCLDHATENSEFWTIEQIRRELFGYYNNFAGSLDPLLLITNTLSQCGFFASNDPAHHQTGYHLERQPEIIITPEGDEQILPDELSL